VCGVNLFVLYVILSFWIVCNLCVCFFVYVCVVCVLCEFICVLSEYVCAV